ncbi:unnamed protein product [Camellia sinensis]
MLDDVETICHLFTYCSLAVKSFGVCFLLCLTWCAFFPFIALPILGEGLEWSKGRRHGIFVAIGFNVELFDVMFGSLKVEGSNVDLMTFSKAARVSAIIKPSDDFEVMNRED